MSSPFGLGAVLPARATLWSRATSARLQVRWGKTSAAERFDLGAVCNPALIDAWLFVFYRCYICSGFGLDVYGYYNSPTLRHSPTSRIRGLNLKGPGGRPRGRGKWRPQENKTQPTATASTGGKKVICGRNAQKYQKCSVDKCPSGARRNRKYRWFTS